MARRTDPAATTVKLIRERDSWACGRCGSGSNLSTQHRVARGMGGARGPGINRPANLLTLCGSGTTGCHGLVEAHPIWAQAHGWSAARWQAPTDVPVWTWRGWVQLLDDGTYVPLENYPGVDDCECGCRAERVTDLWSQGITSI